MTRFVLVFVLALVAGCGQTTRGVLVMAHGGDAQWNSVVEEMVAPLREKYLTEIAFGMADSSTIRTGVRRLEARGVREIAVVRMFISGESFLPETEYILGLRREVPTAAFASQNEKPQDRQGAAEHCQTDGKTDSKGHDGGPAHHMAPLEPISPVAKIVLSRQGVAESPLVDDILVERVKGLSRNPSQESVLILAHGPGDDDENGRWLVNMERRIQRLRELGPFREVRSETLREDWPEKRAKAQQRIRRYVEAGNRDGGRVIVVPFRIAGFGPYAEALQGCDYVADGRGFCPHPNMTRWVASATEACFAGR
ncbi:MAG: hypothetical protein HZB38_14600 [Planctomycetes bacterium]|nr:hypothetical protein [Planctomycetota bacterium]